MCRLALALILFCFMSFSAPLKADSGIQNAPLFVVTIPLVVAVIGILVSGALSEHSEKDLHTVEKISLLTMDRRIRKSDELLLSTFQHPSQLCIRCPLP